MYPCSNARAVRADRSVGALMSDIEPKGLVDGVRPSGPELAALIGLLGGDVRRGILRHLAAGPADVSTLSRTLAVELSVVSHNLRQLRDAGLVKVEPVSRRRMYHLGKCVQANVEHGGETTLEIHTVDGGHLEITTPPDGAAAAH